METGRRGGAIVRGIVGTLLVWSVPFAFVSLPLWFDRIRSDAMLAAVVVALFTIAPLGAALRRQTPLSVEARVARRMNRLRADVPGAADLGWVLLGLIALLNAAFALVGDERFLSAGRLPSDRGRTAWRPLALFGAVGLSLIVAAGALRRTVWAFRRFSRLGEAETPPRREAASPRLALLGLIVAVVAFGAVVVAVVYQLRI